jgi:cytochrome c556
MKKYPACIIALIMTVALVLSLVGCGNEASRARECVEEGDGILAEAAGIGDELTGKVESLLSDLGAELSRGERPDAEKFKEGMEGIHGLFDELDREYEKATSSYGKVECLKGVDDYKDYARTRMAQIVVAEDMLEDIRFHLDKLEFDISDPGFSATALAEEAGGFGEQVERKADEVMELMDKAETIKRAIGQ